MDETKLELSLGPATIEMRNHSLELNNPGSNMSPINDDLSSSDSSEDEPIEGLESEALINADNIVQNEPEDLQWRRFFMRSLALLCAMALSIGAHL